MSSDVRSRAITRDRWRTLLTLSHFSIVAMMIALLLGGVAIALLLGGRYGNLGLYAVGGVIVAPVLAIIVILRQDELAATIVIAVQLAVDFYLGLHVVSQVITLALLLAYFLSRSLRYPWAEPRALWLWSLFLVLTIFPALRGATSLYEAAFYYPNIIFGALNIFWLGTVIARDSTCVRRLFKMLAALGTLVAVHTIIQATTGMSLSVTASQAAFLANVSNYQLFGSDVHRVGSFFLDPNWDGTFLAMTLFLPLGLFIESSSFLEKVLYLAELSLIVPALLFTYSIGAWIGACAGMIAFLLFVGRARYRVLLPSIILIAAIELVVFFPLQIGVLFQRAADPTEASVRVAGWQTAIRLIGAYPLTGVGLSHTLYNEFSAPYDLLGRFGSLGLGHPHDSYLELGAMAGLPVLLVFIALLSFAFWQAFRNWARADARTRSLIGIGIAVAVELSINSVSINGWTLPPPAAMGWLILGAVTSPLLSRGLKRHITEKSAT